MNRQKEVDLLQNAYDRPFESSARQRARYEYQLALDCVLPLLRRWGINPHALRVIDLGCGSGGLVVALAESGAQCLGIDLNDERIREARQMAATHRVTADFQAGDIFQMGRLEDRYDLFVLSETVEHFRTVARVCELLAWCREQLSPLSKVYVSFPPWYGPFAGHQAGWPGIRCIPWYHLLPHTVQKLLVPSQHDAYRKFSLELDHLTIRAFERCVSGTRLNIVRRELYLSRPEYAFRYGVPQVRLPLLAAVPVIREVVTTGAYYLLGSRQPQLPLRLNDTNPKAVQRR